MRTLPRLTVRLGSLPSTSSDMRAHLLQCRTVLTLTRPEEARRTSPSDRRCAASPRFQSALVLQDHSAFEGMRNDMSKQPLRWD